MVGPRWGLEEDVVQIDEGISGEWFRVWEQGTDEWKYIGEKYMLYRVDVLKWNWEYC